MEEEIILEKKYSVSDEMFEKSFDLYQKKFIYPRNAVISVILLIAAVLNVIGIVRGDTSVLRYILVFACLALAAVNFYNPKKIKRNLMEAIKKLDGEDVYRMKILPEKIVISTIIEKADNEETAEEYEEVFEGMPAQETETSDSSIYLNSSVIVLEKTEFFMVYQKKAMFYVIPKKEFSEEEITVMQIHFQKQLGKNYRKIDK